MEQHVGRGGSGAGVGKRKFLAGGDMIWLVAALLFPVAAVGATTIDVFPKNGTEEIASLIANASASEILIVRLQPGEFTHNQTKTLLTTRTRMMEIRATAGGAPIMKCTASATEGPAAIHIEGVMDFMLSGVDGVPIVISGCPLVFHISGGTMLLNAVNVTGGYYDTEAGVSATLAIVGTEKVATSINVTNSNFYDNRATALMIQVPEACVRIDSSHFLHNHVLINNSTVLALNRSGLPLVASGGLTCGVQGNISTLESSPCSMGERERMIISNTEFTDNRVHVNVVPGRSDPDRDTKMHIMDALNHDKSTCGAGAYVYASGDGSLAGDQNGVVHIGAGTTFTNNHAVDVSATAAIGGGLCVHFLQMSENWSFRSQGVDFMGNHAERSGGMHIDVGKYSTNTTVELSGSNFLQNRADPNDQRTFHQSRGGALSFDFGRSCDNNLATVTDTTFTENAASEGGAVHVLYHSSERRNSVILQQCNFTANHGISGAALYVVDSHQHGISSTPLPNGSGTVIDLYVYCTIVHDCTFLDNVAFTSGALSVSYAHVVFKGRVNFTGNLNSAVSLVNTYLYLNQSADVTFYRNIGGIGGAIYLSDSQMIVYSKVNVIFDGNIAQATGGGIHANMHTRAVGLVASELNPHCFLTYYIIGKHLVDWESSTLSFENNMAGQAGGGIFAPDFTPCLFLAAESEDEDIDKLDVKQFKERWDVHFFRNGTAGNVINSDLLFGSPYGGPAGGSSDGIPIPDQAWAKRWLPTTNYSLIDGDKDFDGHSMNNTMSTDVVSVSWHTTQSCPDEPRHDMDPSNKSEIHCNVSPQEYFHLRATAKDQFDQARNALFFVVPEFDENSGTVIVSSPYLLLDNGVTSDLAIAGTPNDTAVFTISIVGTARLVVNTLVVHFFHCSHGFYDGKEPGRVSSAENSTLNICYCGKSRDDRKVQVCEKNRFAYLHDGLWGGDARPDKCNYNNSLNNDPECLVYKTTTDFEVVVCPVGYCRTTVSKTSKCKSSSDGIGCLYNLTDQNAICAHGRRGTLCSQCPENTTRSLTVEDGGCETCPEHSRLKIIGFVLVIPVLVLIVLLLNVPLSNDLRGLFFVAAVSQTLLCPEDLAVLHHEGFSSILTIGAVAWPFSGCVIPGINSLEAITLGYAAPAGSMLVAVILHVLSHPRVSTRFNTWVGASDLNTLKHGTWLILFFCFQKTLQISIKFLMCVPMFGKWRFFYEAEFYCRESPHIYYFVLALFCMLVLGVMMVVCALLSTDTSFLCVKSHPFVGSILRRGLKDNCSWWAVWDLVRRALIYYGALLVVVGCDERQVYMLCVTVLIFAVHLIHQPYVTPREDDIRFRLVTVSTFPGLGSGRNCNILEGVLLFNMVLTAGFSMGYRHYIKASEWILVVLTAWPVVLFLIVFFWKVFALVLLRIQDIFNPKCLRFMNRSAESATDSEDREHHPLKSTGIVNDDEADGRSRPVRIKNLREGMLVPLLDHNATPHTYSSTFEANV